MPNTIASIIEAYDALIDRALAIVEPGGGFYASVDDNDRPRLSLKDDKAILTWRAYESDYYGGGYTTDESTKFPAELLAMSDREFASFQSKIKSEIKEREEKVRRANEAVQRDRDEAHDRAEWARLSKKFGK